MPGLTKSRLLRISSKDRSVESVSKYNIMYQTNSTDLHQIKKVILKYAQIPNTMYNINSYNNTLNFPNTLSGNPIYTIPIGQYTIQALITAIQGLITGLTITQSPLTSKLTFTMVGGTFTIIPNTTINPIAYVLGFETQQTLLTTYTCESIPDLGGLDNVYIGSQALSNHVSMITNTNQRQNVFCNVPIDVAYGFTKTLDEDSYDTLDFTEFHTHKNISSIDITLFDERNNVVDLNGAEWVLIFRVYF